MQSPEKLTDHELLAFLKKGEVDAFNELYERYNGLLFVYAFKLLGDADGAKDMVQELFITIWDKRYQNNYTNSFSAYLYTAIRFKFLKLIKHQEVKSSHADAFLSVFEEAAYTTDVYITQKELIEKVESLVAQLPPKMALVFTLSRMQNFSNQEIADKLNVSEKTVRNILSQAATRLKPKIGLGILLLLLNI